MDEKVHIIWGNSSFSENRVNVLRMNGMKRIFVLDNDQAAFTREKNDIIYFSSKYASLLQKDGPGTIHHFFMHVKRDHYNSKKDNH